MMLKIKDGNGLIEKHDLEDCRVDKKDDNSLLLIFYLSSGDLIKYVIKTDTREPNLSRIERFVSRQLESTDISLREDLTRSYIFIDDGKNSRQFTASKEVKVSDKD